MKTIRDRLASLCAELSRWSSLATIIRANGAGQELDELLASSVGQGLDAERGTVLLDAIEEASLRAGLSGLTRGTGFRPLPPGTRLSAGAPSWVCPHGGCDRVVLEEESNSAPACAVAGGIAMKSFRISL